MVFTLEHKDSSLNLTVVMVFSITEIGYTALLLVWPNFGKNYQIKLKQVGTVASKKNWSSKSCFDAMENAPL
jgi:hypothetical protein